MFDKNNFGLRLTECMKKANINNKELTEQLNLSKNVIGNYKNNNIPNCEILYGLSQKLGTTMEYLLSGKESAPKLNPNESELLELFNQLPEREQLKVIGIVEEKVKNLTPEPMPGKSSTSKVG